MRIKALAIAAAIGLLGLPAVADAAPAAPAREPAGISQQPEFQQVRDGCGYGRHIAPRRDRWGNWHPRCVANRGWGPGPWAGTPWGPGPWRGPYRGPGWGPYYR